MLEEVHAGADEDSVGLGDGVLTFQTVNTPNA